MKVKVVLPVHLTGTPVDLREMKRISKKNNIKIIADPVILSEVNTKEVL